MRTNGEHDATKGRILKIHGLPKEKNFLALVPRYPLSQVVPRRGIGHRRGTLGLSCIQPPIPTVLAPLVQTISQRVAQYPERHRLSLRVIENRSLNLESTQTATPDDLIGDSASYQIAVGPQAGRKALTLPTGPARGGRSRRQ